MAKPDAKKNPMLKQAWDEYGHMIKWEDLFDMKMDRGCYAVVAWKEKDGTIGMADLARGGHDQPWEMQNDGHQEITEADWKKLKIKEDCDWFVIPGNPDFLQR